MKVLLGLTALLLATTASAAKVNVDFESVTGLTALNTDTQNTALPADSSIVTEVPGLWISSLGPAKETVPGSQLSGVSWLDFSGTGSTAKSGTHVIAGANTDFETGDSFLDFNNFVEFRILDATIHTFQIWVELLPGIDKVSVAFRGGDINGSVPLSAKDITTSQLVSFDSAEAIRNVVFIPVGGGMWLDDLTLDTDRPGGGGTVPEPGVLCLLAVALMSASLTVGRRQSIKR